MFSFDCYDIRNMTVSKKYLVWTIIVSVLAIAINIFIIVHSCLNASQSSEASGGVVLLFKNIINFFKPGAINDGNIDTFSGFIRKAVGHFGLFMVSGLLSSLSIYLVFKPMKWSKHYLLVIMGLSFGLLMGIITEVIQLNVEGRSGEFTDVLIDFSGYLLGALIIGLILFLILRKQKHQTPNE